MKKYLPILIVLVAISILGCAAIDKAKANYELCYSDPVCHQGMLNKAKMAGEIGQVAGGASGIPLAGQIAGSIFGGIALLVSGIAGGAALRKKQDSVNAPK